MRQFNLRFFYFLMGILISATVLMLFFVLLGNSVVINYDIAIGHLINIFFIAFSTAIFEELIFRQFLFNFLKKRMLVIYAVLISSLVFALCHLANSHVSIIAILSHFLGGVVYAIAFLKGKNIFYPIGLHLGWNFGQYLVSLPMSGTLKAGIFKIELPDNALLFGGLYGIEGGLYSLLLRSGILVIILYFPSLYTHNQSTNL